MAGPSEPVGIALLFCDYIIEEKGTSKKTLVGTFTNIYSHKFPLKFRPFWMYASLTNLLGEHSFSLNIFSDSTKGVAFSLTGQIKAQDVDAVIEMSFPIQNITFPEEGKYSVILSIDGLSLLNRTLFVRTIKQK